MNINIIESGKKGIRLTNVFIIIYSLWLTTFFVSNLTLMSNFVPNEIFSFIRYSCLIIIIFEQIIRFKISIYETLGYLFIIMSLYIGLKTGQSYLFDISLLIFSSRNYQLKCIFKSFFISVSILILLTIALCVVGIIPNRLFYQNGRIRYSLGFNYTTFSSQLIFFLTMVYFNFKKSNVKFLGYVFFVLLNVGIYIVTDTRNPFILSLTYLVVVFLFSNIKYANKLISKLLWLSVPLFIVCSAITYYFSIKYGDNEFSLQLNKLLSGRLFLSQNALFMYGTTYFGQEVPMVGSAAMKYDNVAFYSQYNYIDSSYIQLIVLQGWVYFYFIITILTLTMKKLLDLKEKILIISMAFVAIHSMIDPQLLMLWYSPFLFCIGIVFNPKKYKY